MVTSNEKSKYGMIFEERLHNFLVEKYEFKKTLRENDIINYMNNDRSYYGIDHYIELDDTYCVIIQDKFCGKIESQQSFSDFFLKSQRLVNKLEKKLVLALFVSIVKQSKTNLERMKEENDKYGNSPYQNIYLFDNIKSSEIDKFDKFILMDKLINKVDKILNAVKFEQHKVLKPYPHQVLASDKTREFFKSNDRGIICHPTGSGKTITALMIIDKLDVNKTLWITERKEVIKSQFEGTNIIDKCFHSKVIKDYIPHYFYNSNKSFDDAINKLDSNKKLLFIANTDSIMTGDKYKELLKRFELLIVDECHNTGATRTYGMISYFQKFSPIKVLGFSATPIRIEDDKCRNICKIFGDKMKPNIIDLMMFFDAIEQNIIKPPKFYWLEVSKNPDKIESQKIRKHFLQKLDDLVLNSKTKCGLMWAQTIKSAMNWADLIKKTELNNLTKFKFCITHAGNKHFKPQDEMMEFKKLSQQNKPCILLCVGRAREGFDNPLIDFGVNLDPVQERSIILFHQSFGRVLRNHIGKEYGMFIETFICENQEDKQKEIIEALTRYVYMLHNLNIENEEDPVQKEKISKRILEKTRFEDNKMIIEIKTNNGTIKIDYIIESLIGGFKSFDIKTANEMLREHINNLLYPQYSEFQKLMKMVKDLRKESSDIINISWYNKQGLVDNPNLKFYWEFSKTGWIKFLGYTDKETKEWYDYESCHDKCLEYLKKYPDIYETDEIGIPKINKITTRLFKLDSKFPVPELWTDFYKIKSESVFFIEKEELKEKEFIDDDLLNF